MVSTAASGTSPAVPSASVTPPSLSSRVCGMAPSSGCRQVPCVLHSVDLARPPAARPWVGSPLSQLSPAPCPGLARATWETPAPCHRGTAIITGAQNAARLRPAAELRPQAGPPACSCPLAPGGQPPPAGWPWAHEGKLD